MGNWQPVHAGMESMIHRISGTAGKCDFVRVSEVHWLCDLFSGTKMGLAGCLYIVNRRFKGF